ncbi:MAG TPA: hypothetical protein VMT19_13200 [Thermoanaerobaculaceae bacterium]|nr:hypothetical protein [Thermoanaerobaculaceae bacterium]
MSRSGFAVWCVFTASAAIAAAGDLAPREPQAEPEAAGQVAGAGCDRGLTVGVELTPLRLPGIVDPDQDVIRLREVAGSGITVRVTPVDERGTPVDGGRVVILRANETRSVRLAETLPAEEVIGRGLLVEALGGTGRAEILAEWLAPAERDAVAATRPARRHLVRVTLPTSEALIDQAEGSGALDHETAVLYRVYAIFGDARLPAAYRGDDSALTDSLYLATVVGEFSSYSPATQAALQPFLIPPTYQQGYQGAAATAMGPESSVGCNISADWTYVENTGGKVRVWYDVNSDDAANARVYLAQAENTILPRLQALMTGHPLLSDDGLSCNGGTDQLDIYICDQNQSVTVPYSGCSNSPVFIRLRRDTITALLAHEMFHAFQFSMPIAGCMSSEEYHWWSEASAQWVQDYVYPYDQDEQFRASTVLFHPDVPLDLNSEPHWYGAYLLPFYVYRSTGSADFVRASWEGCLTQSAVKALDAALPGGFADIWPKFALHNWNHDPVDDYTKWDALKTSTYTAIPGITADASALPDMELALDVVPQHLSAAYKDFVFPDSSISSVAFWNGVTYDLEQQAVPTFGPFWNPQSTSPDAVKGIKVQALMKINGAWTQDDWTNKPYVAFCRDLKAERLEELVIIVSNSRVDDSGGSFKPPGMAPVLWLSGFGCYQWQGTATYTFTGGDYTQTDTVNNLVWTRVPGATQPPSVSYTVTGDVTVTASNGCSGGGTVHVSDPIFNSLVTWNYLPAAAGAVQSYEGEGLETTTMLPITCRGVQEYAEAGNWFNILSGSPPTIPFQRVSTDGKRMTGTLAPGPGISWTWDLHAVQEP